MVTEGLGLMAAGMGMVFAFLILLVAVMKISARIFSHFPDHQPPGHLDQISSRKKLISTKEELAEIAAAIAVTRSRSDS